MKETKQNYMLSKNPVDVNFETEQLMTKLGYSKSEVTEQIYFNVNPRYYWLKDDYQNNCYNVVVAAEMRYRGYNVIANRCNTFDDGTCLGDVPIEGEPLLTKAFKNSISLRFNSLDTIRSKMKEWGNGSRAFVGYQQKNNEVGHVLMAVQNGGETIFEEFQKDFPFEKQIPFIDLSDPSNFFMRVDNLPPTELIKNSILSP